MQCLIVGAPLLAGKSENEVCEAGVPDPISDYLLKTIILGMYIAEIPGTLEGVEVML